ncbi:helix-turn-helix domain-containing protein [Streptomyces sp. NPDC050743]|uniref:helix-turn-helix domain-containing protein n=1 Tax=Streptomyces sp. NPDC050743 TaxID=3365634 RepID=UPI0037B00D9A
MRTQNGESVLARIVRIFEAFTPEDSSLTVSEISRRTGLHVATASRLVAVRASRSIISDAGSLSRCRPPGDQRAN